MRKTNKKTSYRNLYAEREMYGVNSDGTIKTREQDLRERASNFTIEELQRTLNTLNTLNGLVSKR